MTPPQNADRDPAVAELLDDAFISPVDVETAARHLWAIHHEAGLIADEHELVDEQLIEEPKGLRGRRLPRTLAPLVALIMLMSMSGVAVAASRGSLPGDVLYGLKRGQETAQLVLTRDPADRVQLQVEFAETRLEEIRAVATSRPEVVPDLVAEIAETLTEVDRAASTDPDRGPAIAASAARLREATSQQVATLGLSADIDDTVDDVLATTDDADVAAAGPAEDPRVTEPADPRATARPSDSPAGPATAEDKQPLETVSTQPSQVPAGDEVAASTAPTAGAAQPSGQPSAAVGGATTAPAAPPAVTAEPVPDEQATVRPPDVVTGPAQPPSAPAPSAPAPSTPAPEPSASPTPSPSPAASPTPTSVPTPTDAPAPIAPPTASQIPFDSLTPPSTASGPGGPAPAAGLAE